eukprot:6456411-Amphidinium_carterae.2
MALRIRHRCCRGLESWNCRISCNSLGFSPALCSFRTAMYTPIYGTIPLLEKPSIKQPKTTPASLDEISAQEALKPTWACAHAITKRQLCVASCCDPLHVQLTVESRSKGVSA